MILTHGMVLTELRDVEHLKIKEPIYQRIKNSIHIPQQSTNTHYYYGDKTFTEVLAEKAFQTQNYNNKSIIKYTLQTLF